MGRSKRRIQSPEELLPSALKIRTELGKMPSANHLVLNLGIGAPKAAQIIELIEAHDQGVEIAPTVPAVREFIPPWGNESVRMIARDGEPWFVAQDLERELGILNIRQALSLLDGPDKGVCSIYTPGGFQQVVVVSESGMWELFMQGRKEESKRLRKWLAEEVLPSLRKTGSYALPGAQVDRYTNDPLYQMITRVIDNGYQIIALEQRQTTTEGEVESLRAEFKHTGERVDKIENEVAPKVKSFNALFSNGKRWMPLDRVAQNIGYVGDKGASGSITMNNALRSVGVFKKKVPKGPYVPPGPTQKWYMRRDPVLFDVGEHNLQDLYDDPRRPNEVVKVTTVSPAGQEFIRLILKEGNVPDDAWRRVKALAGSL